MLMGMGGGQGMQAEVRGLWCACGDAAKGLVKAQEPMPAGAARILVEVLHICPDHHYQDHLPACPIMPCLTCVLQIPPLVWRQDTESIRDVFAFAGPAPEVSMRGWWAWACEPGCEVCGAYAELQLAGHTAPSTPLHAARERPPGHVGLRLLRPDRAEHPDPRG